MTSAKLLWPPRDFVPESYYAKFGGNWTTNKGEREGRAMCPTQPIFYQNTPAWIRLKILHKHASANSTKSVWDPVCHNDIIIVELKIIIVCKRFYKSHYVKYKVLMGWGNSCFKNKVLFNIFVLETRQMPFLTKFQRFGDLKWWLMFCSSMAIQKVIHGLKNQ